FWPSNRPVRPDGAGFIAAREAGALFYGWDGRKVALDDPDRKDTGRAGALGTLSWAGRVARYQEEKGTIDFDTEKRKIRVVPATPALLPAPGRLTAFHPFPGGGLLCLFVSMTPDGGQEQRLEFQRPTRKERKVILADRAAGVSQVWFPSPNDRLVAVFI